MKLLLPGGAGELKALPLSSVTVCATPSMLSTLTCAPGWTEGGVVNANPWILIAPAVEVGGPRPARGAVPADGVVEPQLVRATRATPHTKVTTGLLGVLIRRPGSRAGRR